MFVTHRKIVQLLLLYCIIVQSYVLCDVGANWTLAQHLESEVSGEITRPIYTNHRVPTSWSDLSPTIRWLFANSLVSIGKKIFGKGPETRPPLPAREGDSRLRNRATRGILDKELVGICSLKLDWKRSKRLIRAIRKRDRSLKETFGQPSYRDKTDYGCYVGWLLPMTIFG